MGANQSRPGFSKRIKNSKQTPKTTVMAMHKAVSWYLLNSKLSKLDDPTYCEDLIILTSDILDKVLTLKEVTYLDQHLKGETVIDKKKTERVMYGWNKGSDTRNNVGDRIQKYKVYDSVKKKRMCKGIAKFYVKFGHLFNAIHKAINPQWVYFDENDNGEKKRIKVADTSKIPKNKMKTRKLIRDSLCSNRLHALYADMIKETIDGKQIDMAKVKMDICNMNNKGLDDVNDKKISGTRLEIIKERMKQQPSSDIRPREEKREMSVNDDRKPERREMSVNDDRKPERREMSVNDDRKPERREMSVNDDRRDRYSRGTTKGLPSSSDKILFARPWKQNGGDNVVVGKNEKSLFDEIGIPELEQLYYDVYNIDKHKYDGMSAESKKKYKEDLATFYKTFTGEESLPGGIDKFSHIRLKSYHKDAICSNPELSWQRKNVIKFDKSRASSEFDIYAKHLSTMSNNTFKYENQLLSILNKLFSKESAPIYTDYGHKTQKKNNVIINPSLDEKNLQTIIEETRKILVEMYVNCHKEFLEGKKKFEAVLNRIGINTQLARLKQLTEEQRKMQIELKKNFT
uniref:Uncharacterized protein n=1 Tax=viral metagenome TaxID=1070528 RepID=A0A6C0CNE1_9ZZZZ